MKDTLEFLGIQKFITVNTNKEKEIYVIQITGENSESQNFLLENTTLPLVVIDFILKYFNCDEKEVFNKASNISNNIKTMRLNIAVKYKNTKGVHKHE